VRGLREKIHDPEQQGKVLRAVYGAAADEAVE
jgi:hypothetical protein